MEAIEDAATASVAAVTEGGATVDFGEEVEVTVRLIDDGALVRWSRPPHDSSRCTVRWYRGETREPVSTVHTHHDYLLGAYISI